MRIGQLARLVGIDTQTIRFYEQQGLLPPPDRQKNGYRVYTEEHGKRLAFIRRCRILDLSLAETSELQSYRVIRMILINLVQPSTPCSMSTSLMCDHR